MMLIFAGNSAEAHAAARYAGLRVPHWAYISNLAKLYRLNLAHGTFDAPLRVLYVGTYRKRKDYEEIEAALFHIGATREVFYPKGV